MGICASATQTVGIVQMCSLDLMLSVLANVTAGDDSGRSEVQNNAYGFIVKRYPTRYYNRSHRQRGCCEGAVSALSNAKYGLFRTSKEDYKCRTEDDASCQHARVIMTSPAQYLQKACHPSHPTPCSLAANQTSTSPGTGSE